MGHIQDWYAEPFRDRLDVGHDFFSFAPIQPRQRFVHEQQLGTGQQGAPHGDTLFFASGQIGRRAVQQPSQTQKRYHVFERYPGRAPEPPPEQHIRAHGQMREQPDVLKNISEPPPFGREAYAPFRIEPDCLTAGDPPCIRAKQPGKALQ